MRNKILYILEFLICFMILVNITSAEQCRDVTYIKGTVYVGESPLNNGVIVAKCEGYNDSQENIKDGIYMIVPFVNANGSSNVALEIYVNSALVKTVYVKINNCGEKKEGFNINIDSASLQNNQTNNVNQSSTSQDSQSSTNQSASSQNQQNNQTNNVNQSNTSQDSQSSTNQFTSSQNQQNNQTNVSNQSVSSQNQQNNQTNVSNQSVSSQNQQTNQTDVSKINISYQPGTSSTNQTNAANANQPDTAQINQTDVPNINQENLSNQSTLSQSTDQFITYGLYLIIIILLIILFIFLIRHNK